MNRPFLDCLLTEATRPFHFAGHFAYHYARCKLSSDCIFREILKRGLLPDQPHIVDLGCGQGSLFSWLLAARQLYELGQWPTDWPTPPSPLSMHGYELMAKDVERAQRTFGPRHPVVTIRQGDMRQAELGQANVVTILDALHYIDYRQQEDLLARIRTALPAGGLFLTRIGDAGAGLPYHLCNLVDRAVTFVRGHRLPQLYCRPLVDWVALLKRTGFSVDTDRMSEGKPFANVMMVCRPQ